MSTTTELVTPSRLRSSASVPSFHSPDKPQLHTSSSTPLSSITRHTPSESPRRPATPSEYLSSPIKHPANAHPYAIHSSSTSILTRTNSSPAKPVEPVRYRPSRSLSSLHYVMEASSSPAGEMQKFDGTSVAVPRRRAALKKSSSIASFTFEKEIKQEERPDLPVNPKSWTANDLAAYLSWTLRTGGPDGTGETMPERLVEDIRSWVYRHRISGRDFLNINSDVWSTSRPPPFLSLLLTISRKLRRQSIQGTSFHLGEPSVFQEEEEEQTDSPVEVLRGVKGLAKAYESIANADEANQVGEIRQLEPQWTGSSTSSSVWECWGLKRQPTGISICSDSSVEESGRPDPLKDTSALTSGKDGGPPVQPGSLSTTLGKSPPPPYASSFLHSDAMRAVAADRPRQAPDEELVISATLSGDSSPPILSPEPEPSLQTEDVPGFGQFPGEKHVRDQLQSYKTLRASDHLPPTLSTLPSAREPDGGDDDADGTGTARRVTLRPLPSQRSTSVQALFSRTEDERDADDFGPNWRTAERKKSDLIEEKLDEICKRLSYLEQRLPGRSARTSPWDFCLAWSENWGVEGLGGLVQGFKAGDLVTISGMAGVLLFTGIGLGMLAGGVLSRRR